MWILKNVPTFSDCVQALSRKRCPFKFPDQSGPHSRPAGAVSRSKNSLTGSASSLMPSLPTLDEAGLPGYQRSGWNGALTPAGVPKDVIARLNAVIVKALNTPETKELFTKQGYETQTGTPEQFAAFIRSEIAQSAKLIKFAGLKPNSAASGRHREEFAAGGRFT